MCFLRNPGAVANFTAVVFAPGSTIYLFIFFFWKEAHFCHAADNGAKSSGSGARRQGCLAAIFLQFRLHHSPVWM